MNRGLNVTVFPSTYGGIHVTVRTLEWGPDGDPANIVEMLDRAYPEHSPDATDADLHLWANKVARLVARSLEDDLFERLRAASGRPVSE
jgi:hypothetical protein